LNSVWELMLARPYLNDGPVLNYEMLPRLQSAVYISPEGVGPNNVSVVYDYWEVELAFPLQDLVFTEVPQPQKIAVPPKNKDIWRINFSRVEYHVIVVNGSFWKDPAYPSEDNWVWTPQGVINMHQPEMWGYLLFSDDPVNTTTPSNISEDWYTRMALMSVYNAESNYLTSSMNDGLYSNDPSALGSAVLTNLTCVNRVPIIATSYLNYEAEIETSYGMIGHIQPNRLTWFTPSSSPSPSPSSSSDDFSDLLWELGIPAGFIAGTITAVVAFSLWQLRRKKSVSINTYTEESKPLRLPNY